MIKTFRMKLTAQKTFSIIIINIIFPSISSHSPLLSLFIHPWWKCNDIKKPISFHLPFHSRMNYHLKNIWRLFPLIFIIKERACEWCRKEKIKIYYILQFPLFSLMRRRKQSEKFLSHLSSSSHPPLSISLDLNEEV